MSLTLLTLTATVTHVTEAREDWEVTEDHVQDQLVQVRNREVTKKLHYSMLSVVSDSSDGNQARVSMWCATARIAAARASLVHALMHIAQQHCSNYIAIVQTITNFLGDSGEKLSA